MKRYLNISGLHFLSKMVKISLEKKDLWIFAAVILFIAGIGYVLAFWDTTKTMFHSADDVKVRLLDGNDYSLQEAITAGKLSGGNSAAYDYFKAELDFPESQAQPALRKDCSSFGVGYDYEKDPADCGVLTTLGDVHLGVEVQSFKDSNGCGVKVVSGGGNACDGSDCQVGIVLKCKKDSTRIFHNATGQAS
jgi:hypothetical protein